MMVSSGVAIAAIVFATVVTIGGGLLELMSLGNSSDSSR